MPNSMPLELVLAGSLMGLFIYELQRAIHYRIFNGTLRFAVEAAITLSLTAAGICSIYLFIKYWLATAWYWPVVLFLLKLITTPPLSIIAGRLLSNQMLAAVAFVGWPVCAYWYYTVIERIAID